MKTRNWRTISWFSRSANRNYDRESFRTFDKKNEKLQKIFENPLGQSLKSAWYFKLPIIPPDISSSTQGTLAQVISEHFSYISPITLKNTFSMEMPLSCYVEGKFSDQEKKNSSLSSRENQDPKVRLGQLMRRSVWNINIRTLPSPYTPFYHDPGYKNVGRFWSLGRAEGGVHMHWNPAFISRHVEWQEMCLEKLKSPISITDYSWYLGLRTLTLTTISSIQMLCFCSVSSLSHISLKFFRYLSRRDVR